jgi:glycosyltransferase involved in cell wall biosynthesis
LIIGIDASKMAQPRAGIGYYIATLTETMSSLDDGSTFILYSSLPLNDIPDKNNVILRYLPSSFPPWWTHFLLPKALKADGVDIFWGGNYAVPIRRGSYRKVSTFHDLAFRKFPATLPVKRLLYLKGLAPYYLKRADRVIVVSNHTARDLYNYYRYPVEKTTVIYLAARKIFFCEVDQEYRDAVLNKHGLDPGYFLFVGTVEPRKGLHTAIEALALLKGKIGSCPPLAVVGQFGWKTNNIMKTVKKHELEDNVIFLDYVEDKEMPALYQGALVLINPSFYEGFSLPMIEAMASRISVISSCSSSLPEVGGDAPLYFRPGDSNHLMQVLEEFLSNQNLQEALPNRGLARARHFSWEKTARETLDLFKDLVGEAL